MSIDFKNSSIIVKPEFSLYPHQIDAIEWMKEREQTVEKNGICGGVLALKMGMGKTFTALVHALSSPKGDSPTLIIASKLVMTEWETQGINKFFDGVKVLYLHKDYIEKKTPINEITVERIKTFDFVITTYDVCVSVNRKTKYYNDCFDHSFTTGKIETVNCRPDSCIPNDVKGFDVLYGIKWERIICDESQRFANPTTVTYYCMMALNAKYKWCLSGTPIRNFDTDIWAQFRFCGYKTINRVAGWKRCGSAQYKEERLSRYVYNLNYEDAGIVLPEKKEYTHFVEMDKEQAQKYETLKAKTHNIYKQMMDGDLDFSCVLGMFVHLRQCAISPYLLQPESKRGDKRSTESKRGVVVIVDPSPKILKVIDIIKEVPQGEKICLFTSFTSCSDLVAATFDLLIPEYGYLQLDGDTVGPERQLILDKFKTDPRYTMLLLTFKVGSEGISITQANHCIIIDPWWNFSTLDQATARMWRTNQTKTVHVHTIITENTVENHIVDICNRKVKVVDEFQGGVTFDKYTMGKIIGV